MTRAKSIEKGDIYLFYRNKVDINRAKSRDDIQRLYLILAPDEIEKARLFVVGKKRLPEIIKGESKSTEREWMMNYMTAKPEKLAKELGPIAYETSTKGKREQGEAIPCAEGRYTIFERDGNTQIAYKLEKPEKPGKAQKEMGILPEASYVISVKNPDIEMKGFPEEKPDFPKNLKNKFADERWLSVDETKFLNYPKAQLLLVGAHKDLSKLDVKITGKPKMFKTLGISHQQFSMETLKEGKFTQPRNIIEAKEPSRDRTKGGKRGGRAALEAASAAGIAKALKGIGFPLKQPQLVEYAKSHKAKADIVDVLEELPKRKKFNNMADVQKAVGEVR